MKLSNATYDILVYIVEIVLPALGVLYAALAELWGLPLALEVVGTVSALTVFLGTVLRISNAQYNKIKE